MPDLPSVLWCC